LHIAAKARTLAARTYSHQTDTLVEEFWRNFSRDDYEMLIGKSKLLYLRQRFLPQVAEKIMRPG
jgi:hypothetical protein